MKEKPQHDYSIVETAVGGLIICGFCGGVVGYLVAVIVHHIFPSACR